MNNQDHIKSIYFAIKEISDKDFQERIWVKNSGPEISSYTEAMCIIYDDFKFKLFLDKHVELNLPLNLYFHLKQLDIKLSSYKEKGNG